MIKIKNRMTTRGICLLLVVGWLAGCCHVQPYQRLYILAEKEGTEPLIGPAADLDPLSLPSSPTAP
jgi:hypothetical protein